MGQIIQIKMHSHVNSGTTYINLTCTSRSEGALYWRRGADDQSGRDGGGDNDTGDGNDNNGDTDNNNEISMATLIMTIMVMILTPMH